MSNQVKIAKAEGKWVVRAGGAIIAETAEALELREGGYPPVIYFPREDIGMAFLEKSDKTSSSPQKGYASYYTISNPGGDIVDVAWSYEDPKGDVAAIKDHIAFFTDRVAVEQL